MGATRSSSPRLRNDEGKKPVDEFTVENSDRGVDASCLGFHPSTGAVGGLLRGLMNGIEESRILLHAQRDQFANQGVEALGLAGGFKHFRPLLRTTGVGCCLASTLGTFGIAQAALHPLA